MLRGITGAAREAQHLGGTPQQCRIPEWLCGSCDEQVLRILGQRQHASSESFLDAAGQWIGPPESVRKFSRSPGTRQFQQREWVAVRLSNDPCSDARIDRSLDHRVQQVARIRLAQPHDHKFRQASEILRKGRLSHCDDEHDPLGLQAPRNKPDRLRRASVKRLGVIDEANEGALRGSGGKQVHHRKPDEEAIRRVRLGQAEGSTERNSLRGRESIQSVQEWNAELM